ncbi:MAG: hypothetical protein M3458_10280 [Acidobacteriota bacterium]|nr:hypothetical protein [Acidobacteriota bacterium]
MRLSRSAPFFVLLGTLFCLLPPWSLAIRQPTDSRHTGRHPSTLQKPSRGSCPSSIAAYHGTAGAGMRAAQPLVESKGGIREDIPEKYTVRYQEWKKEFLSTEAGRKQWDTYEHDSRFTLTITVSRDNSQGATTGKYTWDDSGRLTAANITLGSRIDEGYPNPIYFPVMSSLTPKGSFDVIGGNILAATKIAHEFGHLTHTAAADSTLFGLQNSLMLDYNKLFLSNGRNVRDSRLVDLAQRMGGTPVEIWEDREYWGETSAMRYLHDRLTDESVRCVLFSRIKQRVDLYAKNYHERFLQVAQTSASTSRCGWQ